MADQEKTQQATEHQRREFRKRGDVAKSKELVSIGVLFGGVLTLLVFSGWMIDTFEGFQGDLYLKLQQPFDRNTIGEILSPAFFVTMKILAPLLTAVVLVSIGANVAQVGFMLTGEPLKFDLSKLNPLKRFKQIMFSKNTFFELIKSILKVIIVGSLVSTIFMGSRGLIVSTMGRQIPDILQISGGLILKILMTVLLLLLFLALADFIYQKYQMEEKMMMSHQEIKDEYKQMEGDPHVKMKRRMKQREMSMNRMMQAVPNADVIVTNPTHFAVALRYDRSKNRAPIVVAKGADYIARKIKEIAREHDVPIVENRMLARNLYWNIDIGDPVPDELFKIVAQVLAHVYKIDKRKGDKWLK